MIASQKGTIDNSFDNFEAETKGMNFMEFMLTLRALIRAVSLGSDVLDREIDWKKNFVMKNPTLSDSKEANLPVITWNLKERTPGRVTSEHREIKPRRRQVEVRNKLGKVTGYKTFDGRITENLVEFVVYGHTNEEVLLMTKEFTDMMDTYKGVFMEKGLLNYWFINETEGMQDHMKDEMVSRVISYNVKIQETTEIDIERIKEITLEVDVITSREEVRDLLGF